MLVIAIGSVLVRYVKVFKPQTKPVGIEPGQIRLEIINASGIDKQGKRALVHLRKLGFDVYGVKTAQKEVEKTTIVDHLDNNLRNAKFVAELLGKKKRVVSFIPWYQKIIPETSCDIDSMLYLEASVILGKDCQQFIPKTIIIF